jgi:hypothetical protein
VRLKTSRSPVRLLMWALIFALTSRALCRLKVNRN